MAQTFVYMALNGRLDYKTVFLFNIILIMGLDLNLYHLVNHLLLAITLV